MIFILLLILEADLVFLSFICICLILFFLGIYGFMILLGFDVIMITIEFVDLGFC